MTRRRVWTAGAWVFVVAGTAAVSWAVVAPAAEGDATPVAVSAAPAPSAPRRYPADSLAAVAAGRNVFRVTRAPSPVAYDPAPQVQPVAVAAPPKPVLSLVGIVAGAEPAAVIEGLPGVDGSRVLRVGDRVAGIRLVAIAAGEVRLVGMDTTWVLTVREPWKP